MTRLTFVGDIALDKPLLKAARQADGSFDFSKVFQTQDVFAQSDLVVGNLETVFNGGKKLNTKPYHYNSPDSFCNAIKSAGIGLVSTANNHCADEGVPGILRTLQVLDRVGIDHTGTFSDAAEPRYLVREVNGIRIAFYSLTYSVNSCMEAQTCEDLYSHVNLTGFRKSSGSRFRLWRKNVLRPFLGQTVKKLRKSPTISAHSDYFRVNQIRQEWMDDIEKQLAAARKESDLLVVLLHSGGQFNIEPGEYSKYMMDKLCELGADIVIGNHPHTVQRVENRDGKIVAYSLGGYCMSVSGEYLVHDCLPEYSLALHVDVDEDRKLTSSIVVLKGTEDASAYLTVKKAPEGDPGAEKIRVRAVTAEKEWKRLTLREAAAKRGGKPIRVVLSADDFGRSHEMNVAIDYAMRNGLVRSTALLMGSAFTQEAVEMAKQGGYLENVHCHLNLASCVDVGNHFVPLNDTFKKSRFCKDGEFGSVSCFAYYEKDFYKYKDVIFAELESQFLAFREITEGKANYDHVDFHLYRNLCPPVALAYRKLIRVYGIKTARFIGAHEKESKYRGRRSRYMNKAIFWLVRREKANVMKSSKIEYYIMRQKAFRDDTIVELYVHPEMRDGVIMDRTNSVLGLEMQTLEDQISMVKNLRDTEFIPWSAVK